jgi:hypothetical protein
MLTFLSVCCDLIPSPAVDHGCGKQIRIQGQKDSEHPKKIALPRIKMDLIEDDPATSKHCGNYVPEPNGKPPSWFYQNQQ